jgi:hypothetical protein
MDGDRVPMREGAGEGLRGRVLGGSPVEGAGEQRPEDWAAVALEEQRERLRSAYGHVATSLLDLIPPYAAGVVAAWCCGRS